jgi:hypothetical protein
MFAGNLICLAFEGVYYYYSAAFYSDGLGRGKLKNKKGSNL